MKGSTSVGCIYPGALAKVLSEFLDLLSHKLLFTEEAICGWGWGDQLRLSTCIWEMALWSELQAWVLQLPQG